MDPLLPWIAITFFVFLCAFSLPYLFEMIDNHLIPLFKPSKAHDKHADDKHVDEYDVRIFSAEADTTDETAEIYGPITNQVSAFASFTSAAEVKYTPNNEYVNALRHRRLGFGTGLGYGLLPRRWLASKRIVKIEVDTLDIIGRKTVSKVWKARIGGIVVDRRILRTRSTLQHWFKDLDRMDSLRHSHFLRYVGVHLRQEKLLIITYPSADMPLTVYLDALENGDRDGSNSIVEGGSSLKIFPPCLASALKYLQDHSNGIAYFHPGSIYVAGRPSLGDRSPRIHIWDRTLSRAMRLSEDYGNFSLDVTAESLHHGQETTMGSVLD